MTTLTDEEALEEYYHRGLGKGTIKTVSESNHDHLYKQGLIAPVDKEKMKFRLTPEGKAILEASYGEPLQNCEMAVKA